MAISEKLIKINEEVVTQEELLAQIIAALEGKAIEGSSNGSKIIYIENVMTNTSNTITFNRPDEEDWDLSNPNFIMIYCNVNTEFSEDEINSISAIFTTPNNEIYALFPSQDGGCYISSDSGAFVCNESSITFASDSELLTHYNGFIQNATYSLIAVINSASDNSAISEFEQSLLRGAS